MEERGAQALPKRRLSLRRLEVLFAKAALLPGVERLVRHLHRPASGMSGEQPDWRSSQHYSKSGQIPCRNGVPMAVATSSHRRHFDLKTTLHRDLFDLMHHVVTGDQAGGRCQAQARVKQLSQLQVSKSKPDPEIFCHASSIFDGAPVADNILVFEAWKSCINKLQASMFLFGGCSQRRRSWPCCRNAGAPLTQVRCR